MAQDNPINNLSDLIRYELGVCNHCNSAWIQINETTCKPSPDDYVRFGDVIELFRRVRGGDAAEILRLKAIIEGLNGVRS